ncbi:hypothetical protein C1H46_017315 [Malus baccata]|uniref:1-deoxy-D-xylulose-5-phosphate synthase n=1 Tax=Malus baccata TaxID=106549 RepID=A0A540MEA2_MALBA|nr:hypothetical protein C1H46_017315 [Malus baccata]
MAVFGVFVRPNQYLSSCLIPPPAPKLNHSCRQQLSVKASAGNSDGEDCKLIRKEKDGWKIDYSGEKPGTPLLDTVNYPAHMKNLSTEDLEQLAAEMRVDIVYSVSQSGGHLSSSLGVVELAVALHHVFNTPDDKIIWDVGHQAYPHKILTGRRSKMHTIRKTSGLAGFPKRDESVYDAFGAGHSSTSISAGLEAEIDDKIVAIHAAMGGGTGLNYFQKKFPDRCFDVGIAEQHAVTFAAGLAAEGLKPFCAIYSSFLQRGYDQVIHDVDLQKLPVRFAMDRAGLVGADGPTHCGAFDITYMACLPNMVVMAPSDEAELMNMVATAAAIDDRPSCFRFPRGNGIGALLPVNNKGTPLEVGKGRILMEGSRVAILGYGSIVQQCVEAANKLKTRDIHVTVADARFCKPLDSKLIKQLAREHEILITVEEGSIGGFGSHVSHFLSLSGILDGPLKLRAMVLPDRYIDHGALQDQLEEAGLSSRHISATVLFLLGRPKEALQFN